MLDLVVLRQAFEKPPNLLCHPFGMRLSIVILPLLVASPGKGETCRPVPPAPLSCPTPYREATMGAVRACLDSFSGTPRWATAWYQPSAVHQDRDTCTWRKTPGMPAPSAYVGTGYDKGHLIAFADVSCSEDAASLTCQTGNIAPQPPRDNRGAWAQFEDRLRGWANTAEKGRAIQFVAGPMYRDPPEWVRAGLRKPFGFWKAALTPNGVCGYAQVFGGKVKPLDPRELGFMGKQRSDCMVP